MKSIRSRRVASLLGATLLLSPLVDLAVSPVLAKGHTAAPAAAPVKTRAAHILVTPKGMTLYVFAPDPKDKSTCYNTCAKFWPPRLVKSGTTPKAKLDGILGTFGVTARTDGTQQLTYDGAPLYTFAGDKKAGDMNGQGVVASGGYWWVVVAAGH